MYVTATLLCILLCVLLTVLVAFGSYCFLLNSIPTKLLELKLLTGSEFAVLCTVCVVVC